MAYSKAWAGFFIILMVFLLIGYLFATTYYQVHNNLLRIHSGFLYNLTISIEAIKEIKETRNPISSPALSLDRLLIVYNKYDSVIISPENKQEFIAHLKQLNPAIKIVLKK